MHEQRVRTTTTKSGAIIVGSTFTVSTSTLQQHAPITALPPNAVATWTILDAGGSVWASFRGTWDGTNVVTVTQLMRSSAGYGVTFTLTSGTHDFFLDLGADDWSSRAVASDFVGDYVVRGFGLPTTSVGLTASISGSGNTNVLYVIGRRVELGDIAHTYTASRNTFVDVDYRGFVTFIPVSSGTPALTPNSYRLGYVTTDGTHITGAVDLSNRSAQPYCALALTSTITVAGDATPSILSFGSGTTLSDNTGMHSETSNPTQVLIAQPGTYVVKGEIGYANLSAPGLIYCQILVNGAVQGSSSVRGETSDYPHAQATSIIPAAGVGWTIQARTMQVTGSDQDCGGNLYVARIA